MHSRDAILEILRAAGHAAHADVVAALIQPAIRIHATAAAPRPTHLRRTEADTGLDEAAADALERALATLPLGASRFGGLPDLPPGVGWPQRAGVPMEFIAQLCLAEVAASGGDARLPAQGSLLVFYNSQWTTSDQDEAAACCAVLFHDGPDEALVRAPPPRIEWTSEFAPVPQFAPLVHGLATLRFEPTVMVPGGASPFIPAALEEFWQDFHSESTGLAGEGAPFHENFLLGYVDEQDHIGAHVHGTDDQLLLQVDSEDAAGFQFGDCHKLFFLLHRDELAARDFSRVRVYSELG